VSLGQSPAEVCDPHATATPASPDGEVAESALGAAPSEAIGV
jgi:hypothetical protein